MGFPIGNFRPKLTPNCQFLGKIGKSGKIGKYWKKIKKMKFQQVSIIKINILAKFHHEKTIFDEIRGHLLILPFYRALTRASEGLLREKAIKFEVEMLHTPNFDRICLI